MRILFALSGLHRVHRGAEVAFISIATELAKRGDEVTLIGSGPELPGQAYRYIRAPAISRERFERLPSLPLFRTETVWEEASFIPGLLKAYEPSAYDVTVTCSYPFINWALRAVGGNRPRHVFVTQNGDWPAYANGAEYRLFGCDGLVCINPDYLERNKGRYRCALIPNGVDTSRFTVGTGDPARFGLSAKGPIVLMVSALIPSKNVDQGIEAVARLPGATLVVAGDGPLRDEMQRLADERLPGRYRRFSVPAGAMPDLYRSADAVLHLSRDESFGNVYTEAMASGVPIVAYESARTRWIVGDDGFLADPDDPAALVAQIKRALKRKAAAGPKLTTRAQRFAWPKIAAQYRSFFEEIVAT